MTFSPLLDQLIQGLRCLPGVGPKSAQRMAFHLLERDRDGGKHLADALLQALEHVGHCRLCRTFSEDELCLLCRHQGRELHKLCIVETPADLLAIEQTGTYRGRYFVLLGHLSPLDGIGPEDIGLPALQQRITQEAIQEIILAMSTTVEGEATAHYITEMIKGVKTSISRIAHGIPLGGDLEYIDSRTLAHAFESRLLLSSSSVAE